MVKLKKCCFCFTAKTGAVVLGCLGIIFSILSMIPFVIILENREYYIGEFIKDQRSRGINDFPDSDISAFTYSIELQGSAIVTTDVLFTFASIFLIAGVTAEKRFLLIPWLVTAFCILIVFIILVLAGMFSFASNFSCIIFSVAAPFLLLGFYFWFTVYSAYHQIRKEPCGGIGANGGTSSIESRNLLSSSSSSSSSGGARASTSSSVSVRRGGGGSGAGHIHVVEDEAHSRTTVTSSCGDQLATTPVSVATVAGSTATGGGSPAGSGSLSSLASVKLSLKRAVGATPPPPYEAVALDIDKEEAALAQGIVNQKDLIYTTTGVISASSSNASHKALLQQQLAALRRSASTTSSKSGGGGESSDGASRKETSGCPKEGKKKGGEMSRKGSIGTNGESRSLPEDLQGLDSILVCPEEDEEDGSYTRDDSLLGGIIHSNSPPEKTSSPPSSSSSSARTSFSVDHGLLSRATRMGGNDERASKKDD